MTTEEKEETKTAVSVLDNLKTSNLPEIIGWKEKQEKLVEENPYLEITDTKTYEDACKRRTALLKGRTELQNQDKSIASKLATFRKEVGSETATLIAITQPHEEKQDSEVKRWEGIKAAEKKAKEEAEANRVKAIQDKLESIETESYQIIQSMIFSEIEDKSAKVQLLLQSEDFNFEEYDVMLDQIVSRVETVLESKIKTLTDQENQRLDNLRLEEKNKAAKAKEELQSKRLTELLPYNSYGDTVDMVTLWSLTEENYQSILKSKKELFQKKVDADAQEEQQRVAKEKEEKDAVFEIRKNRLLEVGFIFNDKFYYDDKNISISLLYDTIYNLDTINFENKLNEIKGDISEAKTKAKKIKINDRKDKLLRLGFQIYEGEEYPLKLSENLFINDEILGNRDDEWFDEFVSDSMKHLEKQAEIQKQKDVELAEVDAKRLKAENKARIKQYSKDKKVLTEFVESLDFRNAIPELENQDLEVVVSEFMEVVEKWKAESIELISKY